MSASASKLALPLLVATLATVLAFVYGCGGTSIASDADPSISVVAPPEVEFGKAFPLTIVRTWPIGRSPNAFDDRALAPLATRLESSSVRDADARIEETRRYLCYAFSFDAVLVPSLRMDVASETSSRNGKSARSEPLRLRVKAALDPKAPGAPEGPGAPPGLPPLWLPWLAVALALVALALLERARRRRAARQTPIPSAPPTATGPGPGPAVAALADLARLRQRRDDDRADIVEAGDVVRAYAAERFTVPALKMTSRELIAAISPAAAHAGSSLSGVLRTGDLVKFAEHAPTTEDRDGVLDAAEAFVRATTGSAP